MMQKPFLDIAPEDLTILLAILKKFIPYYEVWAFGSRVTGKARKFSDLDLAVMTLTPLDIDSLIELKSALSTSNLPFKVDIVDWADLDENFRKIIKENFVVLQKYNPCQK